MCQNSARTKSRGLQLVVLENVKILSLGKNIRLGTPPDSVRCAASDRLFVSNFKNLAYLTAVHEVEAGAVATAAAASPQVVQPHPEVVLGCDELTIHKERDAGTDFFFFVFFSFEK